MKAMLEYDLTEDASSFKIASTAIDWALTVFDIDDELRKYQKGWIKAESAEELISTLRKKLCEIMEQRNINLDMIE